MRLPLQLHLGVKTDPIEYRYSYDWLFRLMADEDVRHVQLGTFFEIYQLPDEFFLDLRRKADSYGLTISSVFTAHRELGGFFMPDPAWQEVARKNFVRLIEISGLLGAVSVGSNPGAVWRDRVPTKPEGLRCYLENVKGLMSHAHACGVSTLTIEPMSCLAEPPTLPGEMRDMAEELLAYHRANPETTASVGCCADVAHGYADENSVVRFDNYQLLEASLPYLHEIHLKNTDAKFDKTFGFSEEERARGIVNVAEVRDFLLARADVIPARPLIGYLEIGGPKLGRDYSDRLLGEALRTSLRYLRETWLREGAGRASQDAPITISPAVTNAVKLAPSMMCADMTHLADDLRALESAGADLLHFDLMDGHFVPNMPLGLVTVQQLRPLTALPFDVHLMVENNDFFVRQLLDIGVEQIAVHAESSTHLDRTLALIKSGGAKAGVALNPHTPISALDYSLEQLDFVLLMTVNPGFAGQKMVESALRKIADCRAYLDAHAPHVPIMVDGNVSFENVPAMVSAGADVLVCGTSSIFANGGTYSGNARRTREAAAAGLAERRNYR